MRSIFVMNREGRNVRRITRGACDDAPNWSPDGKRVLFRRHDAIWVVRARLGARPHRLRPHVYSVEAKWSPDGRWLAVSTQRGTLVVMRRDGSNRRAFGAPSPTRAWGYRISWSPDSRRVAFTATWSRVAVADVSTGNVVELDIGHDPSWSPDGTRIVFARGGNESPHEMLVMNADGSNVRSLTGQTFRVVNAMPSWGP